MQLSMYTLVTREFSLEESIQMAAQAGFDAVDIRQAEDGTHMPLDISDEELKKVRARVEETGMHVSGLTNYWRLGTPDTEVAAEHQAGLRRGCEAARTLGAKFLRCSSFDLDFAVGYEKQRELFREQFVQANQIGAEFDITITPEQHGGGMCASAGQIMDLIRGLPADHIGIVYDPGNCVSEGFERIPNQIEMLRNIVKAVHVKNAITVQGEGASGRIPGKQMPLDEGLLDWAEIVSQLKRVGYDNYLTLEELTLHPRFASVQEMIDWDVQYLRGLIESA